MNRRVVPFLVALVAFCFTLPHAEGKEAGRNGLNIIQTTPDGWTVEYAYRPFTESIVVIDGIAHKIFIESPAQPEREGEPMLPVDVLTLGVPFGSLLKAELVDAVYDSLMEQDIAPVPGHRYTDEGEAVELYVKNQQAYENNRFTPQTTLAVDPPILIRQQLLSTLRLHPVQYNPVTRTLKRLIHARIDVRLLTGSKLGTGSVAQSDRHFEESYRDLVDNYEESKLWRIGGDGSDKKVGPDPTRDWFEVGRTYYRIPVASDNWYRVTKADLAQAGADPSSIDPGSLKVYYRGAQIPVVVRPDTSVEFFGLRNYGDTTYIDIYADTSVYWLTWGGTPGLRFVPQVQSPGSPVQTIGSAQLTRHFEENTGYFQGTTQLEVIQNGTVPGEGWYWERLFPNTTIIIPFLLDNIDQGAGTTSVLRARIFSMTSDGPDVDHHARFWINDSLLGEIMFEGRTGVTFSASLPTTWLRSDTNRIRMTSIPTPTIPNLFYLDWFDVTYRRDLRAVGDRLEFISPASSGGGPVEFSVRGFSTSNIEVYDLTGGRKITGGTITGDSLGGFAIAFKDTFSSPRTYVILGNGTAGQTLPLQPKMFSDIRVRPQGADHIIIAHRNFMSFAQQLALHRKNSSNLRVALVDVQDIYDEFNYGVFDATKIKTFLWYAYQHWLSPAPTSVLLFGDASWDFKKYLPSSIKTNFVPAYGVPAGDNWFATFDTTVVPWMNIGRIPVEDSIQAQRTVAKIILYDSYELDEWNKNFLMITGGNSPAEQSSFNNSTESLINLYIQPPPLGGTPYRVYKATAAVIDGENKQYMRNRVRDGVVFVNFLGHSGGRIWGVDIGSPYDLENTNGRLPFVSSVSCNVGAFAEPSNNVLAEDFFMADNRGAIAAWASSSLGYPTPGTILVNHFLGGVRDSLRGLGVLTTNARFRLWQTSPGNAIYQAMVNLNPLIGDPLSRLAIPLKPDLAIRNGDISITQPVPTPNDSLLSVQIKLHNYGLVPADSVEISLTDVHNGQSLPILEKMRVRPPRHRDSLVVSWDGAGQVGLHTLTATLDPQNLITEANELNNVASAIQYVYANLLAVVKPIPNQVVAPGAQTLVVTSPVGRDSAGFSYHFELDTVPTFDSPFKLLSGPVTPGVVSGEWSTPSLPDGKVFFWRARTIDGDLEGNWVTSSFSTSATVPPLPTVQWRQYTSGQFERNSLIQCTTTDSGVTIKPNLPINLYSRSLGNRANLNLDYYSIIRLNELTIVGHWWVLGSSFMVLRVNEFTGAYEFRAFDIASQAAQRDSMRSFIQNTTNGDYLAMSVIFDGKTNVNESLYVALESLGSTLVRQLVPGRSWAFIARKGSPGAALESMTNDSAIVSLQVPNYYSFGKGSMTSERIPVAAVWDSLQWAWTGPSGTEARVALIGARSDGRLDTLRTLSGVETAVSLASLGALTSGPTYSSLRLGGLLSSNDASVTPRLTDWQMRFQLPADLAVSSQTVGYPEEVTVERGTVFNLPVTVYNIGFMDAESARVAVSMFDKFNKARPIAGGMVGAIPVHGSNSTTIPLQTSDFPRRVVLQVAVSPAKKAKDLVPENNITYYSLNVSGILAAGIRLFADGNQLMDGDYVPPQPRILVRVPERNGTHTGIRRVELFVDGMPSGNTPASLQGSDLARTVAEPEVEFTPVLQNGRRELLARVLEPTAFGDVDTLEHLLTVNVLDETRILQVYNYPNPFNGETQFSFVLTGALPPDELSIRIFTVSGRKIKELSVPGSALHVGFNKVAWDGRDSDGDEIANGYYFYQLSTKGSSGELRSSVEKLVKVR